MKRVVVITSMASLHDDICRSLFAEKAPVRSNGGLFGIWGNCQVFVVHTGTGKVNIALAVADAIREVRPDVVFVAGTAKSLTSGLLPGTVIVGSHFRYYDVCLGPMADFGRYANEPSYYFSDDKIVSMMIDVGMVIHQGLVLSGDRIVDNRKDAKRIANHFYKARAVDYESTTVAQVCHRNAVPFVSIRIIDDVPVMEEKAKNMYPQFKKPIDEAAVSEKLFVVLNKTMESL